MIITITGKPCSGKSVVIEKMMEKYGFTKFSAGEIYRKYGQQKGLDVLQTNRSGDHTIDKLVDDEITEIGKRDIDKDIIFDSRTAWHFIPKSFKVFLDIQPEEQVKRLLGSGRTGSENVDISPEQARKDLDERWKLENDRYLLLYGFDNRNPENYDLVIDTTDKKIEEIAEEIYAKYQLHLRDKITL